MIVSRSPLSWPVVSCIAERMTPVSLLKYGDTLMPTAFGDNVGTEVAHPPWKGVTHLIIAPFMSMHTIRGIASFDEYFKQSSERGIETIVVLHTPYGFQVPQSAWENARKDLQNSSARVVLDKSRSTLESLRLTTCECLFHALVDSEGRILWTGKERLDYPAFVQMMNRYAVGDTLGD